MTLNKRRASISAISALAAMLLIFCGEQSLAQTPPAAAPPSAAAPALAAAKSWGYQLQHIKPETLSLFAAGDFAKAEKK